MTVECAVICCCCCGPCGLVNLVAVVTMRLPAVLVRKSLRWRRKLHRKKGAISWTGTSADVRRGAPSSRRRKGAVAGEVPEVKKIMRVSFYCAGFWRSPPAITVIKGGEAYEKLESLRAK